MSTLNSSKIPVLMTFASREISLNYSNWLSGAEGHRASLLNGRYLTAQWCRCSHRISLLEIITSNRPHGSRLPLRLFPNDSSYPNYPTNASWGVVRYITLSLYGFDIWEVR